MSAVTASLCWTLLFVGFFVFVCADLKIITAESGQDVTLTCRAPNDNNIIVVKWSRADLGDKNVLLYRNGQFVPANQHPSFKNRVDLQDRQMKDGDVSVILKDVTTNDDGTYECRVFMEETHSWELSYIYLRVVPLDPNIITAESGQDVSLTCRAPNNKIRVLNWRRADLKPKYVLLYQDEHLDPSNQHPSFKNRVDLQDKQMKDGDVSVILKNVTINDDGTYECRVFMEGTRLWELNSIINLHVIPPGQTGGNLVWMIVCLGILLLLLLLGFLIKRAYTEIQKQQKIRRKQVARYKYSKLNSEPDAAVPRSQSYPTRRKTDDQRQKETDAADLHLQSLV